MANRVDDISRDVKHVATEVGNIGGKMEDIHKVLFKLKRSGTMLVSNTFVRQEMPLKPQIFYGRDDLIEEIAQFLMKEETSRICILGPGGMGKTSVSLAIKIGRAHV